MQRSEDYSYGRISASRHRNAPPVVDLFQLFAPLSEKELAQIQRLEAQKKDPTQKKAVAQEELAQNTPPKAQKEETVPLPELDITITATSVPKPLSELKDLAPKPTVAQAQLAQNTTLKVQKEEIVLQPELDITATSAPEPLSEFESLIKFFESLKDLAPKPIVAQAQLAQNTTPKAQKGGSVSQPKPDTTATFVSRPLLDLTDLEYLNVIPRALLIRVSREHAMLQKQKQHRRRRRTGSQDRRKTQGVS